MEAEGDVVASVSRTLAGSNSKVLWLWQLTSGVLLWHCRCWRESAS
jgi:hypothetical protein